MNISEIYHVYGCLFHNVNTCVCVCVCVCGWVGVYPYTYDCLLIYTIVKEIQ